MKKSLKRFLFVIGTLAVVLIGVVIFARRSGEEGFSPLIKDIILGTLRSGEAGKADPKLVTKSVYTTSEPIALRAVTSLGGNESLTLRVRLLTETGAVEPLTPDTITLGAGRTTFCCWNFSKAGDFTLQLFRPDRTVVSLPIKITLAAKGPGDARKEKIDLGF